MNLFSQHDASLQTAWSNLAESARALDVAIVGTPGGIVTLGSKGKLYLAHQYVGADGTRRQDMIGPIDSPTTAIAADELRARIEATKAMIEQIRVLASLGYQLTDSKTYCVAAALNNAGLFEKGITLIGSHAYGVLLNTLGIRAGAYATHDVDLSRRQAIAALDIDILKLLTATGIEFVPVPPFKRADPSTSYKERGKSRFQVDLLVPSSDENIRVVKTPELNSHATALPYLDFLLQETQLAVLASRYGAVMVRVPAAARFAIHKMITSRLRVNTPDKVGKDLDQASMLLAALATIRPTEIEAAVAALSVSGKAILRTALPLMEQRLSKEFPAALDEMNVALDRDTDHLIP